MGFFGVCREHLRAAEEKAVEDQENAKRRFREWVRTKVPEAEYMNICSGPQVTFFLQCMPTDLDGYAFPGVWELRLGTPFNKWCKQLHYYCMATIRGALLEAGV